MARQVTGAEVFDAVFEAVAGAYQVAIVWATSGRMPPHDCLTDRDVWFLAD
jgi:hypothetical protein